MLVMCVYHPSRLKGFHSVIFGLFRKLEQVSLHIFGNRLELQLSLGRFLFFYCGDFKKKKPIPIGMSFWRECVGIEPTYAATNCNYWF